MQKWRGDGASRGDQSALIVRQVYDLKNKIVPLFYGKLIGYKGQQFDEWLEKIGDDPDVPERYKIIYWLHKYGYYQKRRFIERRTTTGQPDFLGIHL